MEEYDRISHSPTSLAVWALSFVKVCEESGEEKSQETGPNADQVRAMKSFKELERRGRERALFGPG